jgi:PAS domain S-box-containing protein
MAGNVTAEDLRRVVERLSDGLMLFDREGRLLYLNTEAERILGRSGSDLVGTPLRETMPEVVSSMREGARERLRAGEEVLLVQSFFALGRWFEILGRPLGGSFLVHFRDITERLQADAARRQSEERFQILWLAARPTSSSESRWRLPSVTRSKRETRCSASSRTTSETRST